MKAFIALLFVVTLSFSRCEIHAQDKEEKGGKKEKTEKVAPAKSSKEVKRLSELFQKAWKPETTLSDDEHDEFLKLLPTILPGKDYLGEDLEWRLLFKDSDNDDKDLITVNLSEKGSSPYARKMWFHLSYKPNPSPDYGNTEFEGYRAMGLPGVHLLVLVGRIEIRAVAASDSYKRQSKIDEVLNAFPLKKIATL